MSAARPFVMSEAVGDVLSPSTCNQYLGCGAKVYFRKVAKLPDPPTGALTRDPPSTRPSAPTSNRSWKPAPISRPPASRRSTWTPGTAWWRANTRTAPCQRSSGTMRTPRN